MTAIQRAYTERPMLFSAPMVRAILAGEKTQTRRVIKPQPPDTHPHPGFTLFSTCAKDEGAFCWRSSKSSTATVGHRAHCPYGRVGDRLWVRETFHLCPHCERVTSYRAGGWREAPSGAPDDGGDRCDTDDQPLSPKCAAHGWKPSIHMPRWASRITLEVTGVRVERVQNISEADARAEGAASMLVPDDDFPQRSYQLGFKALWARINGAESWAANPWVWIVEFKRV